MNFLVGKIFALKDDEGALSKIKIAVTGAWQGHPSGAFEISPADLQKMVENFNKRAVDVVIDYEHQTLFGGEAPAAGWIKKLSIENNELWGEVEWTEKAKEYIKNREYRYLSPVFEFFGIDEKTGVAKGCNLHSASLTNTPFLDELGEVVANKHKENNVDSKEALEKVAVLETQISALKDENDELKATKEQMNEMVANSKVEAAIAAKKITETQKEWALKYCKSDMAGFDSFLESVIVKQDVPPNDLYANKGEAKKAPVFDILKSAKGE